MNRLSRFLLLAGFLSLASCSMFTMKGPFPAHDEKAVIPEDFLYTKYDPLNEWLDTPVRVAMFDTPLREVFHHPALRGLNFELINLPADKEPVTMDRLAITRRQMLWSVAQDNQLIMTAMFGENGAPSYIAVRPK